MSIDWSKHHRFMPREGWCGPTTIWMILDACGVKKNINKIARAVWKKWYGTPPQLMAAYLARYLGEVGYEDRCGIRDIEWHLKHGRIVIINWMDRGEGHYSIVTGVFNDLVALCDSSTGRSYNWFIAVHDFESVWYDYLADDKRLRVNELLIWVDPKSVRKGFE